MLPTVRSLALALVLLLPQAVTKTLYGDEDLIARLLLDQHHDDGDGDGEPGDPISFPLVDLCSNEDADGDGVPYLIFCQTTYTVDPNCGTQDSCIGRHPQPWNQYAWGGDPDDANGNNPIPYDGLEPLPADVLNLLVGTIQTALNASEDALAQAVAAIEQTREAAEGTVDDSFPISVAMAEVSVLQDADDDGLVTTTLRMCTYEVQRSGTVTKADCGPGSTFGDPDDGDASTPVDRDQVISDVVGTILGLVAQAVAQVQGIVQDVQDDAFGAIEDVLADAFPVVLQYFVASWTEEDGDLVPVVQLEEGTLTLERDGSYTITYGSSVVGRWGDPDDANANNPIPYGFIVTVPEYVLTLLAWAVQEAQDQANGALAQAVALLEQTREAAEEASDGSFPVRVGVPDATAPQDADGDDVWTTTLRTCTYEIQSDATFTNTGCSPGSTVGDPDDGDAAKPVDRDQVISDLVGPPLRAVSETVAQVQGAVDGLQEDALGVVDDILADAFPVVLPYFVPSWNDADGDGVPVVQLEDGTLTLHRDGSYTVSYGSSEVGRWGDPDDGDPENPDGGLSGDPFDWDGDGWTNDVEVSNGGSHPFAPASRPDSDDDGDGVQNMDTPQTVPGTSNGAYGLVATWRPPYGFPPGYGGDGPVYIDGESPARVWAWDPVCLAAVEQRYEECRSDPVLSTVPYAGNVMGDGYGWRWVASVHGAFPQTVNLVVVCTGTPRDLDGDGLPFIRLCERPYTVYPDGRVVASTQETPIGPYLGDYDDSNPNVPIPTSGLGFLVEALQREAQPVVENVLGLVETLPVMAGEIVRDLRTMANRTLENATTLKERLVALAQQTESDLLAEKQELVDAAAGLETLLACLTGRVVAYEDRLVQHVTEYANEPTDARLSQVRSDLIYGSTALVPWLDECQTTTELQELVQRRYESAIALAGEFLGGLADVLGTGDEAHGLVVGYLGAAGKIVQGVLNESLDAARGTVIAVLGLLHEMPGIIDQTVEEYAQHPWEETIQEVYEEVAGEEASRGRASLEFRVVDRDGHALNATLVVKRLGRVVAAGTTDTDGTYRVRLDASTTYEYVVASEGHRGAQGTARTPAEGGTERVQVVLSTTQQAVADTWGPWLVGGLVVVFVVLVVRRRRRA